LAEHAAAVPSPESLLYQVVPCFVAVSFVDVNLHMIQFSVSSALHGIAGALIGAVLDLGGRAALE
jgi:hypothetical protein